MYTGMERLEERIIPVPTLGDHDVLVHVATAACAAPICTSSSATADGVFRAPSTATNGRRHRRRRRRRRALAHRRSGGGAGLGRLCRVPGSGRRHAASVPPGMDLRTAALTEPLAVALHGVTRSGATGSRPGPHHRRWPDRASDSGRPAGPGPARCHRERPARDVTSPSRAGGTATIPKTSSRWGATSIWCRNPTTS